MVAAGFPRTTVAAVLTCRAEPALTIRITTCWCRTLSHSGRFM
jgi:hypothetical protein